MRRRLLTTLHCLFGSTPSSRVSPPGNAAPAPTPAPGCGPWLALVLLSACAPAVGRVEVSPPPPTPATATPAPAPSPDRVWSLADLRAASEQVQGRAVVLQAWVFHVDFDCENTRCRDIPRIWLGHDAQDTTGLVELTDFQFEIPADEEPRWASVAPIELGEGEQYTFRGTYTRDDGQEAFAMLEVFDPASGGWRVPRGAPWHPLQAALHRPDPTP